MGRSVSRSAQGHLILILLHALANRLEICLQVFELEDLVQYGAGRAAHGVSLLLDLQPLLVPVACHLDDRVVLRPLQAGLRKRSHRRRLAPRRVIVRRRHQAVRRSALEQRRKRSSILQLARSSADQHEVCAIEVGLALKRATGAETTRRYVIVVVGLGGLQSGDRMANRQARRPRPGPCALRSRHPARLPAAAVGWAKRIDPLLRLEVEGIHRLGSLGYQTGPSEPRLTTSGAADGLRARSG